MYNEIAQNKRKTVILIVLFVLLVGLFGLGYGYYSGDYFGGLFMAGVISSGMSIFSYFKSDSVALVSSGAKVIKESDNKYLYRLVENLAIASGIPMPRVAIMDDPAINAFATGRNPEHAVIAVTTGAIEKLEKVELEGVLAHEMSHIRNYDILVMTIVVVLVGTIALMADMMRYGFFGRSQDNKNGGGALAIVALVLMILSPLIAQLIKLAVSRQREYLADASAALLTRFPDGLARALEKIEADGNVLKKANHATAHLYIANPFRAGAMARAFSTHPPIKERITRLRDMIK